MTALTTRTSSEDYFNKCVSLLHRYRWIYEKQNTHLLTDKVLENIPDEWSEYFRRISSHEVYNNIALGIIDEKSPLTFRKFMKEIDDLKLHYKYTPGIIDLKPKYRLTQKKMHEILHLAPVIHSECAKFAIDYVIDVGAGLGYLPQLLFENYRYNILAIEGNNEYVKTATKQQTDESREHIKYEHLVVDSNSAKDIARLLQENFPKFNSKDDSVCIVALHACADLTVHIIKIFSQIPFAKCAVVMPCCYHRLEGNDSCFINFPLSQSLKRECSDYPETCFTRPFLRLACQESNMAWKNMTSEEHTLRARNCLLRNILQEVVDDEGITITRKKRKTGGKNSGYTIDTFLSHLELSYAFTLRKNEPAGEDVLNGIKNKILNRYLNTYRNSLCLIEAISALQAALQSICENVILLDRCAYANELGLVCYINKVTDASLSPRCFALLASKE